LEGDLIDAKFGFERYAEVCNSFSDSSIFAAVSLGHDCRALLDLGGC
jgi:hypothetical protein